MFKLKLKKNNNIQSLNILKKQQMSQENLLNKDFNHKIKIKKFKNTNNKK